MNLQSSTLLSEDTGVPFDQLQAEQIRLYRQAWAEQGWGREPRVSVSRSVLPITEDIDRLYFGDQGHDDQIGLLEACDPGSAGRTPVNRTGSPPNSPRTRRSSRPTRCCSPCRTSLASNTTPDPGHDRRGHRARHRLAPPGSPPRPERVLGTLPGRAARDPVGRWQRR